MASILKVERIVPKPNNKNEERDRYEITKRYEKDRYTNKDKVIQVFPYIGVKLHNNPKEIMKNEFEYDLDAAGTLFYAISKQTSELLTETREMDKYLNENSLTKGKKDAILIERRGFVAAGSRMPYDLDTSTDSIDTPYETIVFCLESILATLKSMSNFNRELELHVTRKINVFLAANKQIKEYNKPIIRTLLPLLLTMYYPLGTLRDFRKLSILKLVVSRARTLSPCEDYSSNIIPSLRSETAIKGSKKFFDYAINDLMKTIHTRLENYGHFLKTSHEGMIIKINLSISFILLIIAIGSLMIKFLPKLIGYFF